MQVDFTIATYRKLLDSIIDSGYQIITFKDYCEGVRPEKFIILRHDVDAKPLNSLRFAKIQNQLGIKGTYYFRMVNTSYNEDVMVEMDNLGHEIGYHYETMDTCRGNIDKAYHEFCANLQKMRRLMPIHTISMHGSPTSRFDNREIWNKYSYRELGLLGEPYFDLDFNSTYYITDTGRRWDGHRYNVRDRATAGNPLTNVAFIEANYHTSHDIIKAIKNQLFPPYVMLNFHPQRWNSNLAPWLKEYVWQNIKNQGKRVLIYFRRQK